MVIKKKTSSTRSKKTVAKKPAAKEAAVEKPIGEITHFFSHLSVGIIKLKDTLKVGERIKIKGATSDFEQDIGSMQIEHEQVQQAKKGALIGIKVDDKVREGDLVYRAE